MQEECVRLKMKAMELHRGVRSNENKDDPPSPHMSLNDNVDLFGPLERNDEMNEEMEDHSYFIKP